MVRSGKTHRIHLIVLSLMAVVLWSACSGGAGPGGKTVVVSIVYGSEKQEWLDPLVEQYNQAKHTTSSGATIVVKAEAMGSIESVNAILEERSQPTVWSPASSLYIPVANAEWRKRHSSDLVVGTPDNLVLSPVVIAMWEPMAKALGWPDTPIGWADISRLAASDQGWAAYSYPEWGIFKFGHTHPGFSNSGVAAILAEAYAGSGKQRDLTLQNLGSADLKTFMTQVESSIIHYGTSTGFFAQRMFERGPSYLSAAVLYENLIVAQESKRLTNQSAQIPVVAIYPAEGTFWSNHPYVILSAPWVSEEQKTAAGDFKAFLLDKPQQTRALELGFRPADPSIPLNTPLDKQHGIDPTQPKTILEVPRAEVIQAVQALWREVKKPVDVELVIDTSGSMAGDKIASARNSLVQFVNVLDNRDRLKVVTFSSQIFTLSELSALGQKRQDVINRVSGIVEGGDTRLYDATLTAYQDLTARGDPKHIRAIVVLTDGKDTQSDNTLKQVMAEIQKTGGEGGNAIKLFTIAFGDDADKKVLKDMAEATGGRQYNSTPSTINQVYGDIATFF